MASPGLPCPAGAGGGDPEVEEEPLDSLLEASRTPEGRSRLAPHLPAVLRRLRPDLPLPLLIPTLRLLRNLCAGKPAGQAAFLAAGGTGAVASVVLGGGGAGECPVPVDVARVGLQLLGNVAAAGEKGQRDVWNRFFPEGLLELARVRDAGACDALCMVLRSCCGSAGEGSAGRLEELCIVGRGLPILKEVLATACSARRRLLLSILLEEEEMFDAVIQFVCEEMDTPPRIPRRMMNTSEYTGEMWTISHYVNKLAIALASLKDDYILQPTHTNEIHPHIAGNERFYPFFKNAIGAIDGTHIPANLPIEDHPRFRNRKQQITQNVMAVVSFDGRFVYACVGWEGGYAKIGSSAHGCEGSHAMLKSRAICRGWRRTSFPGVAAVACNAIDELRRQ
ncbi:hypothetical protein Taro_014304 [Colocasia esculenta]|uniref:DDE Tnp4 domain-containing protein n=1 Tax=Colocasia esculenta TaxID=4460 RepID=A0A843UED0_COLES|nr:hypothetical protein [Colocasia esculenta]